MSDKFNPEMMVLARERRGWRQTTLARAVGITQATISRYESGRVTPLAEHLAKIAEVLDRPQSFFFMEGEMFGASATFHRARASLSVSAEQKIHAQVNELRIRTAILLRDADVEGKYEFHRLDVAKLGPENAAQRLRQLWQMPIGPVRSVVNSIERSGGIVFRCEFETDKIDGVSQWPLGCSEPPVFFVRDNMPGDRQRWTLAHEIGHMVMHHLPSDDPETEADRFASEFLMPAREVGRELRGLTLSRAAALKSYWKTSMASIIRRAYDLEFLTERQYRYLYMELSKRGYRKCEPVEVKPEQPALFDEIIRLHRTTLRKSARELSAQLGMHEHQFRDEFWKGSAGVRLAM